MRLKVIAFSFILVLYTSKGLQQKPIVVITASYNNKSWCGAYFNSIAQQQYENWTVIYIDDNSNDQTFKCMHSLITEHQLEDKFILISNDQRRGHLYNQYHAIHTIPANSIVIIVDGDDWLANEHVFETINALYQDEDVWLSYGQFLYWKKNKKGFCRAIPHNIIEQNGIRDITWRTSHLRTFYAGLFQAIAYEDLLYQGSFFPKCADVVTMFAMIEMAAFHVRFIPDILYIYNDDNPLSYHHDPTHQRELEAYIRKMPRYAPLKEKTW